MEMTDGKFLWARQCHFTNKPTMTVVLNFFFFETKKDEVDIFNNFFSVPQKQVWYDYGPGGN